MLLLSLKQLLPGRILRVFGQKKRGRKAQFLVGNYGVCWHGGKPDQTRISYISLATFTHQRTFFTHGKTNSRSLEPIWSYDCLSNVWPNQQYEMGGSGGGIFNFFYLWKIWNLLAWGLFRCFGNVRGACKEGKRVMACRTMSNDKDCLRMEVVWPQTTTEQADVEALPPRG